MTNLGASGNDEGQRSLHVVLPTCIESRCLCHRWGGIWVCSARCVSCSACYGSSWQRPGCLLWTLSADRKCKCITSIAVIPSKDCFHENVSPRRLLFDHLTAHDSSIGSPKNHWGLTCLCPSDPRKMMWTFPSHLNVICSNKRWRKSPKLETEFYGWPQGHEISLYVILDWTSILQKVSFK